MSFTSPNMDWEVPTVGADRNVWGRFLNAIIYPGSPSATSLDSSLFALFNTNIGPTAPTYPNIAAGRQWVDTSNSALYKFKMWDGAAWVEIGEIDPTAHTFSIPGSTFIVGQMIMWAGVSTVPARWLACNGADVSRATYVALFEALTFTKTCDTSTGSAIITNLSSTSDLYVGMNVEVNGVPYPSTIASIDSATQITLNNNASSNQVGVTIRFLPYGAATLQTNFKIPNLSGRAPKASGDNGNTLNYQIGVSFGKDFTQDMLNHTHDPSVGSTPSGGLSGYIQTQNASTARISNAGAVNVNAFGTTGTVTASSIGGNVVSSLDIRNPFQIINSYIIYAGV